MVIKTSRYDLNNFYNSHSNSGMATPKAIAIIDDEADLVDLFQEILESDGFKVCAFTDPIQANNHIQKNPDDYDLIPLIIC